MDNLQVFFLWLEENRAKKIYHQNRIFMYIRYFQANEQQNLMNFPCNLMHL